MKVKFGKKLWNLIPLPKEGPLSHHRGCLQVRQESSFWGPTPHLRSQKLCLTRPLHEPHAHRSVVQEHPLQEELRFRHPHIVNEWLQNQFLTSDRIRGLNGVVLPWKMSAYYFIMKSSATSRRNGSLGLDVLDSNEFITLVVKGNA